MKCLASRTAVLGAPWLLGCADVAEPPRAPAESVLAQTAQVAEVGPHTPPRTASYTLSARLDPSSHRIHGRGRVVFVNRSDKPLEQLWFHLYLNAFKHERTLFLREHASGFRGRRGELQFGFVELHSLRAHRVDRAAEDLLAARQPIAEGSDESELAVRLREPLAPGESLELEMEWLSQLPSVMLRTGFADSFHFAGQWFPKLAKLEPSGEFAHFPFHRFSEFYADFGDYEVELEAPAAFVLGASGERVQASTESGTRRERYRLQGAHDFAFTAYDAFQERSELIDGVQVRALAPPDHEAVLERQLAALRFALPHFRERYGRYPYPTLTVVHPPGAAAEAGGMEYPTLITTGGDPRTPSFVHSPELVTLHEFGHQYFYGLLASNEFAEPYLDEGLTSFVEARAIDQMFGPARGVFGLGALRLGDAEGHALLARRHAVDAPVASRANAFPSGAAYGALVYSRSATLLETLRRVHGTERFELALARYTQAQRFRHPDGDALLEVVARELGEDAAEFLRRGLRERATVDFAVLDVRSAARSEPGGYVGEGAQRRLTPRERGIDFVHELVLARRGELAIDCEVELHFGDGSHQRLIWRGAEPGPSKLWRLEHPARLEAVQIDPERKLLIEDRWSNNHWRRQPEGSGGSQRLSWSVASLLATLWEAL